MSASVPPPPPAGPPPSGPPPSGWSPQGNPSPIPPGSYPVGFAFSSPGTIARWRPLVHWLLAIPHFIVLYVLNIVAGVLVIIAWFAGVFAGKIPEGIQGLIVATFRYSARVQTYVFFLREEYPPFAFDTDFTDPGTDPRTRFDVVPAIEGRSRLTIFFRGLLIIPHFVVAFFLFIALYVVYVIGWFAVIILGRWPAGLESFVVGFIRWTSRLNAYANLLTDEFPPFGFE
ncbi:MAG: DUF4389 domain-containing protein [Aeromicrobium sp.]